MSKHQANTHDRCNELIDVLADAMKGTCQRLYNSGGVNVEDYSPEEYVLAKILVTAAMRKHSEDYSPLDPKWRREALNLAHF